MLIILLISYLFKANFAFDTKKLHGQYVHLVE